MKGINMDQSHFPGWNPDVNLDSFSLNSLHLISHQVLLFLPHNDLFLIILSFKRRIFLISSFQGLIQQELLR